MELRHVPNSATFGMHNVPQAGTATYYTHDNGGRPFKVKMEGDAVEVYKQSGWDEKKRETLYETEPAHEFKTQRVFVGHSPFNQMTSFSGGHGSAFDGNTILLHTQGLEYVHIGGNIFSFVASSVIAEYSSPVGNNDVPYPYAIDKEGNHYLMIEGVKLSKTPENMDDPYNYYYDDQNVVVSNDQVSRITRSASFDGIKKVYRKENGGERIYLWYQPESEDLGYDWTRRARHGGKIWGQRERGTPRFEITKDMYMDIMIRFGEEKGFSPLNSTIIEPRQW